MKTSVVFGAFWLALTGISGCTAQIIPTNWKTDCVGRMQISLPGEADIAAMLPKDLIKRLNDKGDSPHKFTDGQAASWSSSGMFEITHPIAQEEKQSLDAIVGNDWDEEKVFYKKKSKKTGESLLLSELQKSEYVKFAWRGKNYFRALLSG